LDSDGYRVGQALARQESQFSRHFVRLFTLDVHAHGIMLPLGVFFYPGQFRPVGVSACSHALAEQRGLVPMPQKGVLLERADIGNNTSVNRP
jgi:hypothetical protein